jgi:hypothetical protein
MPTMKVAERKNINHVTHFKMECRKNFLFCFRPNITFGVAHGTLRPMLTWNWYFGKISEWKMLRTSTSSLSIMRGRIRILSLSPSAYAHICIYVYVYIFYSSCNLFKYNPQPWAVSQHHCHSRRQAWLCQAQCHLLLWWGPWPWSSPGEPQCLSVWRHRARVPHDENNTISP